MRASICSIAVFEAPEPHLKSQMVMVFVPELEAEPEAEPDAASFLAQAVKSEAQARSPARAADSFFIQFLLESPSLRASFLKWDRIPAASRVVPAGIEV